MCDEHIIILRIYKTIYRLRLWWSVAIVDDDLYRTIVEYGAQLCILRQNTCDKKMSYTFLITFSDFTSLLTKPICDLNR